MEYIPEMEWIGELTSCVLNDFSIRPFLTEVLALLGNLSRFMHVLFLGLRYTPYSFRKPSSKSLVLLVCAIICHLNLLELLRNQTLKNNMNLLFSVHIEEVDSAYNLIPREFDTARIFRE